VNTARERNERDLALRRQIPRASLNRRTRAADRLTDGGGGGDGAVADVAISDVVSLHSLHAPRYATAAHLSLLARHLPGG